MKTEKECNSRKLYSSTTKLYEFKYFIVIKILLFHNRAGIKKIWKIIKILGNKRVLDYYYYFNNVYMSGTKWMAFYGIHDKIVILLAANVKTQEEFMHINTIFYFSKIWNKKHLHQTFYLKKWKKYEKCFNSYFEYYNANIYIWPIHFAFF